ncbi:MAG: DUF1849 family protein [Proteobacteria bacterium]|nr:DUF1849 family protein [Pseudomonadota bacterium]
MTRILKSLLLALVASIMASPVVLAQSAGLASYEATYQLTLGDIDYKGAIITAKGAMAMRVRRDCTRWQSHSEFLFMLELDSGEKIRTHTMFRQRESLDGQSIEFNYWQELSDSGRLEFRGNATIPLDGEPGTVNYVKPKRFEKKLPKGVEMPITAMRQIVESLITEGATPKHNYFDPQAKFVEIRSIGGDPIILAIPPKGDAGLVDGRSWRLRATPIPDGQEEQEDKDEELKEEEEEAFTMIQIHDSGVASFMVMKSGITTIHAELTEVRQLPAPDCSRPKPPELELSEDCVDGKAGRKEEDLAEGEEAMDEEVTDEEAKEEESEDSEVTEASAEDSQKVTDCEEFVKEEPVEGEKVEAAPVEDVETDPTDNTDELPAAMPATEPTDEAKNDSTGPAAVLPTITEASATN